MVAVPADELMESIAYGREMKPVAEVFSHPFRKRRGKDGARMLDAWTQDAWRRMAGVQVREPATERLPAAKIEAG